MKSLLLALALQSMIATSALAVGVDMTVGACPGNSGASMSAGTLDCAGGQQVALLVTFMPAEAIPDLVGVDIMFAMQVSGDLTSGAAFWDFSSANPAGIRTIAHAPATGCDGYRDLWTGPNSESAAAAGMPWAGFERITASAFCNPCAGFAVAANERVFGVQLLVDTGSSVEAGGAQPGCGTAVCIAVDQCRPGSPSLESITPLWSSSLMGNQVTFNAGEYAQCLAVPAHRHTWGQLKSLYR